MRVHICAKYYHLTPENLGGHVTLSTHPFGLIFVGHVRTVPGNTYANFEVRSFNLLELLAFNAEKFRGSRDLATPPCGKIFRDHVWTAPGKTFVKFQVRSYDRF